MAPKEAHDRFRELQRLTGVSFGDVPREYLGLQEQRVLDGRKLGHREGYNEAEAIFAMRYRCAGCGEVLTVSTPDERKAIARFVRAEGWGHKNCVC